jgi:hypothetical protein
MDGLAESLGRSPELFPYVLDVGKDTLSLIRLTNPTMKKQVFSTAASSRRAQSAAPSPGARSRPPSKRPSSPKAAALYSTSAMWVRPCSPGCSAPIHGVFALREPQILRLFAQIRSEPETQARVWSDAISIRD